MSDRPEHNFQESSQGSKAANNDLFVVGIGASAGGLSALEELFNNLSTASGAAFVVIQHLSPDFKSLMKELLERRTSMPVYRVTEGMELEPNSVYLIPPGQNLALEKNALRLEDRKKDKNKKHELNFPIDLFFTSLAKNYGEQSLGVILSGSGSDGTRGLKAINEAGGLALVQDPETAEFDGMPVSAIATGVVNQVLPPRELSQLIYQCVVAPVSFPKTESSTSNLINSANLSLIAKLLIDEEGLDFSQYKSSTISRRIHRRCLIHNSESIDQYIKLLSNSKVERQILCSDLLINVTHFFRDYPAWQNLENNILPQLIEQSKAEAELRFWITACSTGEEAYSLAILVHEALEDSDKNLRVKIFATDIDRTALEKASQGIYSPSIATDIGSERLQKYFIAKDNSYQVMRKIREMLIFSPHDLTKDAGFTRINLVTCRNVLIYMKSDLQYQVLRNLHFSLVSKGVLFLGEAETLGEFESEFEPLDKKWKFYQKRRDIRLPLPLRSTPRIGKSSLSQFSQIQNRVQFEPILEQCLNRLSNESDTIILLISRDNHLLHVSGNSSKIFKTPDGKVTTEVIKMVVLPLQLPLNTALHRAKQKRKSVLYKGIKLEDRGEMFNINLEVIPPQSDRKHGDFFLVKIKQEIAIAPLEIPEAENFELGSEASRRILELENELQQTRENLQALVEELETTNEEQQASNEELTASNEELQSTNEELHSVNEELHTVNIEYQSKISELTQLNDDVDNLLQSTEIGVIFLDSELKIRKFTPAITTAIALRPADLDRPLEDLYWKFECPNLFDLLYEVLTTKKSQELEVKLKQTESYLLMQIHLYQTESKDSEGLVISFIQIDEIKQAQQKLEREIVARKRSEEQLRINQEQLLITQQQVENIFSFLEDAVWSLDLPTRKLGYLNTSFERIYGRSKKEFYANSTLWLDVIYPQDKDMVEEAHRLIKQQEKLYIEYRIIHPDGSIRWVRDRSKVIYDDRGTPIRQDFIVSDITKQKQASIQAEETLKRSIDRFRNTFEQAAVGVAHLSPEGKFIKVNQRLCNILGYTNDALLSTTFQAITHPEDLKQDIEYVAQMLSGEISNYSMEKRYLKSDRSMVWANLTVSLVRDDLGQPDYFISVIEDITERKKTEIALEKSTIKLKQANQAKDNFIAHMSHELRTPLNSVIGFSQILKQDVSLDQKQLKSIDIVNQSGKHLLTLINDVLDLSKLTANKLELQYHELNLISFLHEITTIFQIRAHEKNLSFITQISPDLPTVISADETRLRQVLFNILSNAFKFTSTGTVILSVNCVAETSASKIETIRFQVEDTGRGIAEDNYDTVFTPFGQVDQSHNNSEGTGLGLSICQNILQLMGSQLHLESKVGQGSRFWFDLDRKEVFTCSLPNSREFDGQAGQTLVKPCKVLVVDDNADNRMLLVQYLQPLGFTIEEAENGQIGLAIALEFQPDVILVDLLMPVMDGKEMSDRIRQSLDLKVILETATQEIRTLLDCDFVGLTSLNQENVAIEAYSSREKIEIDPQKFISYDDLCPSQDVYQSYLKGQIEVMEKRNIQDHSEVTSLLNRQVRLIVPILIKDTNYTSGFFSPAEDTMFTHNILYGWVIVDQYSSFRVWQTAEISLLRDLTTQLAIGIKQGLLHKQLSQLALLDSLTQVYNRRSFDRQLKREWGKLKRIPAPLSLIMCDVDCFKIYNDTYGHQQGDRCLQQVAQAISSALKRPGDILARYGGEEFAIILPHTPQAGAAQVGELIRRAVKELKIPHHNSLVDSVVTVSLGIASTIPDSVDYPQLLIEAADLALYKAKERGRDCVAVYSESISRSKDRQELKIRWVKRLREALNNNLFSLYAQSITPLKGDDSRKCFEVLLRLTDRADKVILPGAFIDIAERNFLMIDIDTWVINNLFETLEKCDRNIWENHRFSINLSGASLSNESFLQFLKRRLTNCPLPANLFCFEITESVAVSDLKRIVEFINSLKKIGCSFALDDFGKGVSSLTYLKNLPVDYLKIDGSFIKELNINPASKIMVEAINHIAEGIGLKTVAEFVENENILNSVRDLNIDYAQGFHLSRPRALMDVIE
ncbi:Protein-glutamate methylesterase (modular protein) [Hyella patelloides LEGE 07179]|uniref:Circadian input-output histidine kinase CikA n=1 Tax=Hyella patelloides LEGE 07179 TaxID=945734 RepID=A0A563VMJ4_9CYAN|nr:EAL domain-containing protein [Hyella patelloides]VEP12505.1 Protein-glutamate methylesterase (modular protein) [Hyella patelloides LEGE 07179]